jgi:hypothetical protein
MKFKNLSLVVAFSIFSLGACQEEQDGLVKKEDISQETLDKIYKLGFGTTDVKKIPEGYLVEGDIVLTDSELNAKHDAQFLRIGETEQYRTTNLVSVSSTTVRTIRVGITTTLPSSYVAALDEAINRYNAQNLRIRFTRVSSSPNITISKAPTGATYLASAGFPSGGNPYNSVVVNSAAIGTSPATSYLATILAHEIGHCIGFRHTDYMDRSYSCGGAYTNEGASSVGAIHIPGTPTTADATSWMLACIGTGQSRPFNTNDRTALNYLY